MLWWIVLPFQITFALAIALVVTVTLAVPRKFASKLFTFFCVSGVVLVGFIPACMGIMGKLDESRFGQFAYDDASQVTDAKLLTWLPAAATEIEAELRIEGNRSQFSITQSQIDQWHKEVWQAEGFPTPPLPREARDAMGDFEKYFQGLGWQPPEDLVIYEGPRAEDGAGSMIWYSPALQRAYQNCAYW